MCALAERPIDGLEDDSPKGSRPRLQGGGADPLLRALGKDEVDDEPIEIESKLNTLGFSAALWATRAISGADRELRSSLPFARCGLPQEPTSIRWPQRAIRVRRPGHWRETRPRKHRLTAFVPWSEVNGQRCEANALAQANRSSSKTQGGLISS